MGKRALVAMTLGMLAILVLATGVQAVGNGSVSVYYWLPEVFGVDTAVGMNQDWDTEWSGVGDPITLEYPSTNGLEVRAEKSFGNIKLGASYWSLDSSADLDFAANTEDGVILPIYIHPDWADCYHGLEEGAVSGTGELETAIFDLEIGPNAEGLSLVGGLRNIELTKTEDVMFSASGYYGTYGQTSKDVSEASMLGPVIGLAGHNAVGERLKMAAAAKVGILVNSLTVTATQYDYSTTEGGEMEVDTVFVDTTRELSQPVLSFDLDLGASYEINSRLAVVVGYRAVLLKDAVGRIVCPDDYNESMNVLEFSDVGFQGGRVGLVYSF